ncbi:MAG TPA: tripartite tricarboxylate transporter substrate binding protein [Ramlibacter sp.]|nr:tripartite tricarboxylate transporter substrate binding protein [Ramlibacter sp.]
MLTHSSRRQGVTLLLAAAACLAFQPASGQSNWPDKPVRLVITTPPGGPIDTLARVLGEAVSRQLKQPVLVENRPGASGAIALGHVMKQPADGYTLLITANASFSLIPHVRPMPNKLEDFSYVGQLVYTPNVVVVPASSPARSLKDLVALAKPGASKLNYGMMAGVPQHLDVERFKKDTGADLLMVPYPGGAPIVTALLGGQVDMTLFNAPLFAEHAKAGKLRVLATTAKNRIAMMPDVPTLREAGFPNLKLSEGSFYSLAAPRGLPQALSDRIYQQFTAAAKEPEVRKKLEAAGFELQPADGNALRAELQEESRDNAALVKALNIKLAE